jgi:hypothetical protein
MMIQMNFHLPIQLQPKCVVSRPGMAFLCTIDRVSAFIAARIDALLVPSRMVKHEATLRAPLHHSVDILSAPALVEGLR